MIDIWDQQSLIGNTTSGNWRSISPSQMDDNKAEGQLIIDSLYRYGNGTEVLSGYWTYKIGYYNPTFLQPSDFPGNFNGLNYNNSVNKMLYDSINKRYYHIAYIKYITELLSGYEGFEITIRRDSGDPELDNQSGLQLFTPLTFINNFKDFELYSSKIITSQITPTTELGVYTKFIDVRKLEDSVITDRNRYVDENNKIYLRVRVNRNKQFPTTKINIDNDNLQFIREVIQDANNPWKTDCQWNNQFNYKNIELLENVEKLGLTYFKLASI
jgi:hypothetical protein